jgi:RNA polymerase sigma-70 factor (ECF subfamily)
MTTGEFEPIDANEPSRPEQSLVSDSAQAAGVLAIGGEVTVIPANRITDIPSDRLERNRIIKQTVLSVQHYLSVAKEYEKSQDATTQGLAATYRQHAQENFGDIVKLTYRDVRGTIASRFSFDEEAINDIVQDAYVKAFKGIHRFKGNSQFSSWMYRVTMSAGKNYAWQLKRHKHEDIADLSPRTERRSLSYESGDYHGDKRALLKEILDELKPVDRQLVWMRYVDDRPVEEVAEVMGKTEATTKVRAHRALKRLREKLEQRGLSADDLL